MASSKKTDFKQIDFSSLWHPFTQTSVWTGNDPLVIERGEGCELIDTQGERYLDGVSSLWCNVHGHGNEHIVKRIREQAEKLCHSTLLGLSHVPVLQLCEQLRTFVPKHLTRYFFSDSGSAAVEAALRMAIEWQQLTSKGKDGKAKHKIVSLVEAYHGDTIGSVSVGFLDHFHQSLKGMVFPTIRATPPHFYRFYQGLSEGDAVSKAIAELKAIFESQGHEIAAMIVEPLIQAAAGMWTYSPEFLRAAADLCKKHKVLLIVDEVATGFGKTGSMFAFEQALDRSSAQPELLIMGKGLSGGYLPMSCVAATEEIFSAFIGEPAELKTFYFGQTFAGNPLAASAAVANLELFSAQPIVSQVRARAEFFRSKLEQYIAPLVHVDEIRQLGLMVGIELTRTPGTRDAYASNELAGHRVMLAARKRNLIIRPLGNVMILMPAVAMHEEQIERLVLGTAESIREVLGN